MAGGNNKTKQKQAKVANKKVSVYFILLWIRLLLV